MNTDESCCSELELDRILQAMATLHVNVSPSALAGEEVITDAPPSKRRGGGRRVSGLCAHIHTFPHR